MFVLTKSTLALMISFIISVIMGYFMIPLLKKLNIGQRISVFVGSSHKNKNGIPTMGGLIFIVPTIITILIMYFTNKININSNLLIILFVFIAYAFLGFLDDFMKIKKKQNEGLTDVQKLLGQVIIAVVFFFIYMKSGSEPLLWFHAFNLKINIGWIYGFFILFVLVASSNAVNITDGLDGLAGGLSFIATLVLGVIAWSTNWLLGYQDIAIFCFILAGAILGFLVYNVYPARVFMGDTGSLAIGGALGSIAILTRHELTFAVIMGVFVIETLSVIIQVFSVLVFKRKVFLMTPLHHNFEKLGWKEQDIVKVFWIAGLVLGALAIVYGAWI
ncbi:MAG: phospho-N-acetylmuramoyl-pentapeptide-transferase [Tenericutes bacterium]|nr:phospho-N-acetylmuramoyl-pentapeptide-transferase [Mycoplasmatota bacterium]